MSSARENILQRLRGASKNIKPAPIPNMQLPAMSMADRLTQLTNAMQLAHTQIIDTTESEWPAALLLLASEQKLKHWLISSASASAQKFADNAGLCQQPLTLTRYNKSFALLKETVFHQIDASLTDTAGAIADTGTLLLLPSVAEPRAMSLVPPVHVALLRTSTLVSNFNELIVQQGWPDNAMPTNALLISGPSKTADIQQTLAYGAHGPKALIVLLIHDHKELDRNH
ncbi:MAG: LUD domain-containing protein [Hahellaceae bacterium]|nr:LUD domain-containing protein [Hahellaceae bacterium]MCP5211356.1 LUD domain-containing protein [Hahellaceae bacterium]